MPNWCVNQLYITGNKKDRKRFKETVTLKENDSDKETPLSFKTIIPCPPDEDNEWCRNHWGTKWDACEVSCIPDGDELVYGFETAWSPPSPVMMKASRQFPSLHFRLVYAEGGAGFWGEEEYENGKMLERAYTHEEYLELYNEEFREEKNSIEELSYEDLKKRLLMEESYFEYHQNELRALKRIKDEDLPLFVGHNWENPDCIELFEERIKKC